MPRRRKKAPGFDNWLGNTALPVFVLDADRKIVAFNAGCELLTGWRAAEVLGVTCRYASTADLEGSAVLADSLCPPPEAATVEMVATPAYVPHKDGRIVPQVLHFIRLRDEKGRPAGLAGFALPLSQATASTEVSHARRLHAELAGLKASGRARFGAQSFVGRSTAFRKVLSQVEIARQTRAFVLLQGEPGTGKEHLARIIHNAGAVNEQWFVPLDCHRLGADELERVWQRVVDRRHRPSTTTDGPAPGTVYFAEVEFLPREIQEQIIRLFSPDDPQARPPLRLISSTTVDPSAAQSDGRLRADFLALISPLTIELPPLRDRGNDLQLLAQHFLEESNRHKTKQLGGFDDAVWPCLHRYDWPGNLDELLAVVGEARQHAGGPLIRVDDLPFRFRNALEAQHLPPPPLLPTLSLDRLLTRVETQLIELALSRAKNNKSKAAQILGVARARLLRRIEQLGLENGRSTEPLSASVVELTDELLKDELPES